MGASICQVNQLGGLDPLISLWYHIYLWVQIFCWTSCWILFFMCELKRKFLCMLLALGSVRMWNCHYPMQCSDLLSKTQPLYMRCFPCVTWLQRGAVSRKPGNKIVCPCSYDMWWGGHLLDLSTLRLKLRSWWPFWWRLRHCQVFQYSVFQSLGRRRVWQWVMCYIYWSPL